MCLTNHTKVKAMALEMAKRKRNGKFTRVSSKFVDRLETHVRLWIEQAIDTHPSVGKTLM